MEAVTTTVARCSEPPKLSRMDSKNTRSVLNVFPGNGFFWVFTGDWQLLQFREVTSGQPSLVVPWIEGNDSPKRRLWPNRAKTQFFLETEAQCLYFFGGKMKTWEHFWQLHGDEVAAVFYDDDEEDEFRTDIIYIVTQKGNVIFCNVKLVEHGNDVKPVVTLFSALMDVFPRCSILDFAIRRTYRQSLAQVERQDIIRQLKQKWGFIQKLWVKFQEVPEQTKNRSGMIGTSKYPDQLQQMLDDEQKLIKRLCDAIEELMELGDIQSNRLDEQLKKVKSACADILKDTSLSARVIDALKNIEESLNADADTIASLMVEQEKIDRLAAQAKEFLNMFGSFVAMLEEARLEDSDKDDVMIMKEEAKKLMLETIDGLVNHCTEMKHDPISICPISELPQTFESDSWHLSASMEQLKAKQQKVSELMIKYKIKSSGKREFWSVPEPKEKIDKVEKRLRDRMGRELAAFSRLKTRWNVLHDILPFVQAIDGILYRITAVEAKEMEDDAAMNREQIVNNIFLLTTESIYYYSSVETPTLMLHQIPLHRTRMKRRKIAPELSESPSIFDVFFEDRCMIDNEIPSFQSPAQLITSSEGYKMPDFLLYNRREKDVQQLVIASYENNKWNFEPRMTFSKRPILFYGFTTASLILVDETEAQECPLKGKDLQPLWPKPVTFGGGITGAQYSSHYGIFLFNSSSVGCINRSATDKFLFNKFLTEENFENARKLAKTQAEIREVRSGEVVKQLGKFLCDEYTNPTMKEERENRIKILQEIVKNSKLNLYEVVILLLDKKRLRTRLVTSIHRMGSSNHLTSDFFRWANELLIQYLGQILTKYHWKRVIQREILCLILVSMYMSRLCEAIPLRLIQQGSPKPFQWSDLTEYADFCEFVEEYRDIIPKELAYEIVGQYPIVDGLIIIASCGIRDSRRCLHWTSDDLKNDIDWEVLADALVQKTLLLMAVPDLTDEESVWLEELFETSVTVICAMYENHKGKDQLPYIRDIFQAHLTRLISSPTRFKPDFQGKFFSTCVKIIKEMKVPPSATAVSLLCGVGVISSYESNKKNEGLGKLLQEIRIYLEAFYSQPMALVGERAGLNLLASLKTRDPEVSDKEVIGFLKDKKLELDLSLLAQCAQSIAKGNESADNKSQLALSDPERVKKIAAKLFELEGMILCAFQVVISMDFTHVVQRAVRLMSRVDDGDTLELMFMAAHHRFGSSDSLPDKQIYHSICRQMLTRPTPVFDSLFTRLSSYIPYEVLISTHNTDETGARMIETFLTRHETEKDNTSRELNEVLQKRDHSELHGNSGPVSIHPYSGCDLCHMILLPEPYNIYHCGHKVHIRCLKARIAELSAGENETQMLKECPFCGDQAIKQAFGDHRTDLMFSEYAMSASEYTKNFHPEYSDDEDMDYTF